MICLCNWFDRYRDGELHPEQREQFEAHLITCNNCRQRNILLDNMIQALKMRPLPLPEVCPEHIARQAIQNCDSWDVVLVSWLKPISAWAAVALLLMVSALLWVLPAMPATSAYPEYEALMMGLDPNGSIENTPLTQADEDLITWLELGGNIP
jgi:anti-sigma factor RsiW